MNHEDIKKEIRDIEERIAALREKISQPAEINWAPGLKLEIQPKEDQGRLLVRHAELGSTIVNYEQDHLVLIALPQDGDTPVLSLSFERARLVKDVRHDDGKPLVGFFENASRHVVEVVSETGEVVRYRAPGSNNSSITLRETFLAQYVSFVGPVYWPVRVDTTWLRLAVPAYMGNDQIPHMERPVGNYLLNIVDDLTYDAETDAFVIGAGTPEAKAYPAQEISVHGTRKTVYAIGAGVWDWTIAPSDD